MTEAKGLELNSSNEGLWISPQAKNFLNSPYREKFMTKFEIGSNKIILYGNPIVMTLHSGLIESIIEKDPPYILLNFGIVLERPITAFWLYLNDIGGTDSGIFNLEEYLQLGRLFNYFGLKDSADYYQDWAAHINNRIKDASETDRKLIESNKEVIAQALDEYLGMALGVDTLRDILQSTYEKYPDILKLLNYVPIIKDGKVATYIKKKDVGSPIIWNDLDVTRDYDYDKDKNTITISGAPSERVVLPDMLSMFSMLQRF